MQASYIKRMTTNYIYVFNVVTLFDIILYGYILHSTYIRVSVIIAINKYIQLCGLSI